MGYITPDELPDATLCRAIYIPDDAAIIAAVTGALMDLTLDYNWTSEGGVSAEDTANFLQEMFDDFCINGDCETVTAREIAEIVWLASPTTSNSKLLACDGASLLRSAYPDLFSAIGTTFGAVDGTHFNVPDLRGRVTLGVGTGTGLSARALGDKMGAETHTLSTAELAIHSHTNSTHQHTIPDHDHLLQRYTSGAGGANLPAPGTASASPADLTISTKPASLTTNLAGGQATGAAGSGNAHNNMQPSLALNPFIVAEL